MFSWLRREKGLGDRLEHLVTGGGFNGRAVVKSGLNGNGSGLNGTGINGTAAMNGAEIKVGHHLETNGFDPGTETIPFITLQGVNKVYETEAGVFVALKDVDLAIGRGEFTAVVGKSGSGKSTLINMLTGIDHPTSGVVRISETALFDLDEGQMAEWRGRNMGIVFQFFQLLPALTIVENVMIPMDLARMYAPGERHERAMALLERVGMADDADKFPAAVSGGQQQKAAIARALANDPPIIVADEPTGNLDSRSAEAVFGLFESLAAGGKTVLMVTHDDELAGRAGRQITLADGRIVNSAGK